MNLKNLIKLNFAMFALIAILSGMSFAQMSTVYVDVTNGSDTYTGENATNSPAGSGPKATIAEGLKVVGNNGKVVIAAGTYAEPLAITSVANGGVLPNAVKNLTVEFRQLNANNKVDVTGGDFTFNVTDGALSIVTTNGTEYVSLSGGDVNLLAGTVNIANSSNFQLKTSATISIVNSAAFTGAAPKKGTNVSLSYTGTGSFMAGKEASYGDFGTGTISVAKTAGTKVTFDWAITKVASITLTSGDADFNYAVTTQGAITITNGDHAFKGAVTAANTIAVVAGTSTFTDVTLSTSVNDAILVTNAAVSFSGAVDVKGGDIINNGTKAVTFNGAVDLAYKNAAAAETDIAQVINSNSGSIEFKGATTWGGSAKITAANKNFVGAGFPAIANTSAGTVTFNGISLVHPNTATADDNYSVFIDAQNTSTGTLTLGTITANQANSSDNATFVVLSATNTAAGTMSLDGNIRGSVVNASTGTVNVSAASTIGGALTNTAAASGIININGNTTVAGIVTNGANKTIALGANTLTVNNAANTFDGPSVVSGTGTVKVGATSTFTNNNAGAASIAKLPTVEVANPLTIAGAGAFEVSNDFKVNANANINFATEVKGNTTFTTGTLAIAANTILTVNNFTMSGGTLATSTTNGVLAVKGNFFRTAGTYNIVGGTAEIRFIGAGDQTFNPGPLLSIDKLTFANTTGVITLGASPRVANNLTIVAGANVTLGTYNIILNANNASVVNNGTYTAVGGGGVIFGGATTVQYGIPVTGTTISGTGAYSYITVDVGTANHVRVTSAKVKFNGVLTLKSGDLVVNDGNDFAPTGTSASIIRYVNAAGSANGIVTAIVAPGVATGKFNTDVPTDYDLTYTGVLGAPASVTAGVSEFDLAHVKNLTVSTTANTLTLLSAAAVTVKGNMTLSPSAVFALDNGAPFNVDVKGMLTVSTGADLTNGAAANTFKLSTNGLTHQITGKITAAHQLTLDGTAITVNGTTAAAPAVAAAGFAELANLSVAANAAVTLKDIQKISGTVTTGATSTTTLGMADEKVITGLITLGGANFALTSDVEAQAGVAHNKGVLDFAASNLTLTTAGSFVKGAAADAIYSSTGGYLVQKLAGLNIDLKAATIPYMRIDAATVLVDHMTVGEVLDHKSGSITSGGKNITINKAFNTVGGPADFTGAGKVVLAATSTLTASGNVAISNVEVNGTKATFASNNATARTLVISDVLTETAGEFAIGNNHISLIGAPAAAFVRVAGIVTADNGQFIFGGVAPQTFTQGAGLIIPNLTINNAAGVTSADVDFTVAKNLRLVNGTLSSVNDNRLHLSDMATVTRDASVSMLAKVPAFDGKVNVVYVTASGSTAKELPVATEKINDLTIDPGVAGTITLNANATVNGTIYLTSGIFSEGTKALTLANGATINRSAGAFNPGHVPTVTSYNLIYSGAGVPVSTTNEDFQAGLANWTIATTAGTVTTLHKSLTLNGNFILNAAGSGALELNGKVLTFNGDVTVTAGTFNNSVLTTANLAFAGTKKQTLTVPATGLVLPGTVAAASNPVDVELNNSSADGVVLANGNLTMGKDAVIWFKNGVLDAGTNVVKLDAPTFGKGQGFDRSGVSNSAISHIVGTVAKQLLNNSTIMGSTESRSEFPTGSKTSYKPVAITFNPNYGVPTVPNTTLYVSNNDVIPTGTVGLPIADGVAPGVAVSRYPSFNWSIAASPTSINPSIVFDLELGAGGFAGFDDINNVRIIRRNGTLNDVTNQWLLQGGTSLLAYDNKVVNGFPSVVVRNATAGLIAGGSVFTFGLKSNLSVVNPIADKTVTVGDAAIKVALKTPAVFAGNTGALVFTTQSSNVTVATAAVVNDTLQVTPVAAGSAIISVTAKDVNNDFRTTSFNVTVAPKNNFAVSGVVKYNNSAAAALANVTVTLVPGGKTATTDAQGKFTFADVQNGTYTVTATSTTAWPTLAITSADALEVLKYGAKMVTLDPVQLLAADVNNNTSVTSSDALMILRRAAKLDNSFAKGDWTFESVAINVAGADLANVTVKGMAVGDVNANYAASVTKTAATVQLSNEGTVKISQKNAFAMPVKAAADMSVNAMTVTFNYDANQVKFNGVASNLNGLIANAKDGKITIAWADLKTADLKAGADLFTLNFVPVEEFKAGAKFDVELDNSYSEFVNADGKVISAALKAATAEKYVPTEYTLSQNYPNPFNPSTTIAYELPMNGKVNLVVFNALGEEVATLVNAIQEAGSYKVNFNAHNLTSGIYFYRLNVEGADKNFTKTFKMVLMK